MARNIRRKFRPFSSKSRKQRGLDVIRMRRRIEQSADEFGGMFYGHFSSDILDTGSQRYDFFFLGKDRFTVYNATIATAPVALDDIVDRLVWERFNSRLTQEQLEDLNRLEFEPADRAPNGKILTYTLVFPEDLPMAELDGLTPEAFRERERERIFTHERPDVFASYKLDPGYRYGIGLNMIVAEDVITKKVIERSIQHFFNQGAKNWKSDIPVDQGLLGSTPGAGENSLFCTTEGSDAATDKGESN